MPFSHKAMAAAAALYIGAGAASAASVTVGGSAGSLPGSANLFSDELLAAFGGNLAFYSGGASLTLSGPARVSFTRVGAESGYNNDFLVNGSVVLSEAGDFGNGQNFLTYGNGASFETILATLSGTTLQFDSRDASGVQNAAVGASPFGIFVDKSKSKHTVLFLAFDDQIQNDDDNHDDFVVRMEVSAVPLPAAGWLLVAGLGGLVAMRKRKSA
jgi:hypothetical protein